MSTPTTPFPVLRALGQSQRDEALQIMFAIQKVHLGHVLKYGPDIENATIAAIKTAFDPPTEPSNPTPHQMDPLSRRIAQHTLRNPARRWSRITEQYHQPNIAPLGGQVTSTIDPTQAPNAPPVNPPAQPAEAATPAPHPLIDSVRSQVPQTQLGPHVDDHPMTSPQGDLPSSPQGDHPSGPQGDLPSGPQGNLPSGPQGDHPSGPQGDLPSSAQGDLPSGPQGNLPSGPQGDHPSGPQGDHPSGPQGDQPPEVSEDQEPSHDEEPILDPIAFYSAQLAVILELFRHTANHAQTRGLELSPTSARVLQLLNQAVSGDQGH